MGCDLCATEDQARNADEGSPKGLLFEALHEVLGNTDPEGVDPDDVSELGYGELRKSLRQLPAAQYRALHLLVNAAMLGTASGSPPIVDEAGLRHVLQPYNGRALGRDTSALAHFMGHTWSDWRVLGHLLNCSTEKLCLFVHDILHRYRSVVFSGVPTTGVTAAGVTDLRVGRLATADARLRWETAFGGLVAVGVGNVDAVVSEFFSARTGRESDAVSASVSPGELRELVAVKAGHDMEAGAEDDDAIEGLVDVPCRYCEEIITAGTKAASVPAPALANVCNKPACQAKVVTACRKSLPCGHACGGVQGEDHCLPCMTEGCADQQMDGNELCMLCCTCMQVVVSDRNMRVCNIWFGTVTDNLKYAPVIKLSCDHVVHLHCAKRQLEAKWPTPQITFGFLGCAMCRVCAACDGG